MRARGPRRWSGQGAGRPRGPSAAVLPGPLAPRVCLGRCPRVPGRRDTSTRRGRPGVGGGEGSRTAAGGGVGGRPLRPPHSHSDTVCQRVSSPTSGSRDGVVVPPGEATTGVSGDGAPTPSRNPALAALPSFGVSRGRTPARTLRRAARWTAPSGLLDPRTPRLDGVSSERCQAITRTPASGWMKS